MRNIWENNDLSGGESGYMLFYFNQKINDNHVDNNIVNSNQQIGAIYRNNQSTHSGNEHHGNSPKAVGLDP